MFKHSANHAYMLQVNVGGNWHDVHAVGKAGGANMARASAKRTGNSHRVLNMTIREVYVECLPK